VETTRTKAAGSTAHANTRAEGRVTPSIVSGSLVFIDENLVSLPNLLEFLLRALVTGILIRMKLYGKLAISLLDIFGACIPINS
jgi:hypothetical protein